MNKFLQYFSHANCRVNNLKQLYFVHLWGGGGGGGLEEGGDDKLEKSLPIFFMWNCQAFQ